ncbi:AtpZ/AtpI family protein [Aquimarina agarivorans]|uniref:AtpZ/AtpI family protein n=1 Tax=Aquimarina agarivorans TaxID=980584 RepID=UPI001EE644DE|nr:AtpZ/AtpI family protein [Aquimarina agarivorans]
MFTGIGIQMGALIYGGSQLGIWLDTKNNYTEPFYETWITLVAVFLAIAGVIIQVIKFSK